MNDPQRVAVVGATGYAGFELAQLLLRHPKIQKPTFYLRESSAHVKCLTEIFPHLRGWGEAPCKTFSVDAVAGSGAGTVFLATPHEASLEMVPQLLNAGLRVVDLSGAFRFHDPETFAHWYKLPAPPKESGGRSRVRFAGALCRSIAGRAPRRQSRLLPDERDSRPAAARGIGLDRAERGIVADCKSGATGAGKEPKKELHFAEVDENFRAYGLFSHRHTPEVTDHTGIAGEDIVFTTHLLPVARGILSTLYVWFAEPHTAEEVESLYRAFYADRPMMRIWPAGKLPELQHVAHTNFCDIGFALDPAGRRLAVVSCLDNLGKGAAGQAVQNMNLMMGIPEATGLR